MIDAHELAEEWDGQAYWRREKAAQHPNDTRNAEAAEIWESLATSARKGDIDDQLISTLNEILTDEAKAEKLLEVMQEEYRQVGFWSHPRIPNELLQRLIDGVGA